MSQFVESLKRLFTTGSVTDEKLMELQSAEKLTEAEVIYIKG